MRNLEEDFKESAANQTLSVDCLFSGVLQYMHGGLVCIQYGGLVCIQALQICRKTHAGTMTNYCMFLGGFQQ